MTQSGHRPDEVRSEIIHVRWSGLHGLRPLTKSPNNARSHAHWTDVL